MIDYGGGLIFPDSWAYGPPDPPPDPREICEEYAGHEWAPAGGGMLICMRCEAEQWDDSDPMAGKEN